MSQRPIRRLYLVVITSIAILGVIIGMRYLLPLFLPFVFAYFFAWIAAPMVKALTMKGRLPRGVASVIVVTLFLLLLLGIICFVGQAFLHQIQMFLSNLPQYQQMLLRFLGRICPRFDRMLGLDAGTCYGIVAERIKGISLMLENPPIDGTWFRAIGVIKILFAIGWNLIIVFIATLLWVKDFDAYKQEFKEFRFYEEVHMVTKVLSDMGIAYLKAQLILLCITAVICTIGIFLTGNAYAILIGIGIGIFDAFPILGSAFILIPWALILLIKKRIMAGIIILVTYLICQLTRQILEPKLVGDGIGVRSVYILISMYVGLKLYGGFGFILGPVTLIAIKAIVNAVQTRNKRLTNKTT